EPALPLSGTVFGPDGRAAAGVALEVASPERPDGKTAVTGADGRYSVRLPAGAYQLSLGQAGPFNGVPVVLAPVAGRGAGGGVGPGPGTAGLSVRVRPEPGRALWVLRGDPPPPGSSPRELLGAPYGQLVYQPRTERVVFEGLRPGRYSVVWGPYYQAGSAP